MLIRARAVVTMVGAPIENGAVVIRGNQIADVGAYSKSGGEQVIDLGDSVLLPGLINAHCHLDYSCLRGKIPPQQSFADWIRAINRAKANLTLDDYLESIAEGIAEALRFGTTAIVNLEAYPKLIARCEPTPFRTWWCAELIDVTAPTESERLLSAALDDLKVAKGNDAIGLAPHALFTASPKLYRRCQEAVSSGESLLTTHLAESAEEMEMFRSRTGALFEFLTGLGRDMSDCRGITPLGAFLGMVKNSSTSLCFAQNDEEKEHAPGRDSERADWIIAHLNELAESDFELLQNLPRKFSVAHCPRSHAYFGHRRFEFEKLETLGFNISLATDSLASNDDLSLLAEARQFQKIYPTVGSENILSMITTKPAQALNFAAGEIRQGLLADMIALPISGPGEICEQIINFADTVPWRMINGQIL